MKNQLKMKKMVRSMKRRRYQRVLLKHDRLLELINEAQPWLKSGREGTSCGLDADPLPLPPLQVFLPPLLTLFAVPQFYSYFHTHSLLNPIQGVCVSAINLIPTLFWRRVLAHSFLVVLHFVIQSTMYIYRPL